MILRVIWRYMDPDGYLCRSVVTKRMPYHRSSRSLDTARLQRNPIAINLTKQDFHASYWPVIVVGCLELLATFWQTLLSMPLLHGPFCKEIFWSVFHFKQLSGFVICIYIYIYIYIYICICRERERKRESLLRKLLWWHHMPPISTLFCAKRSTHDDVHLYHLTNHRDVWMRYISSYADLKRTRIMAGKAGEPILG